MSRPADRWIRWTTTGCVALLALIAGTVSYLHMHTLVELHGQPGWVAALTPLSVDGMIVAASTTGAHPPEPLQRIVAPGDWSVFAVSWHPQGRQIAVATEGSRVRVYDLSGEEVRERLAIKAAGLSGLVHGVAFSPVVPVWLRPATTRSPAFGMWPAVGSCWRSATIAHCGPWPSAGMAPALRLAARTSAPVCGMRPAARGCLRSATMMRVRAVAFSSDGTRLATGSLDRSVQIWPLAADSVI
jgi:WD40 repeat protein